MNEHAEYLVTGKREYRGHKPGTRFEAALDGSVAARAIARGDICLLRKIVPDLEVGSYTLPDAWPPGRSVVASRSPEAPEGASLIEGGGG